MAGRQRLPWEGSLSWAHTDSSEQLATGRGLESGRGTLAGKATQVRGPDGAVKPEQCLPTKGLVGESSPRRDKARGHHQRWFKLMGESKSVKTQPAVGKTELMSNVFPDKYVLKDTWLENAFSWMWKHFSRLNSFLSYTWFQVIRGGKLAMCGRQQKVGGGFLESG